jgi:hypothetical protein
MHQFPPDAFLERPRRLIWRPGSTPPTLRRGALVTQAKKLSEKRIFRYWVEIRELATGSVRKLPLTAVRMVCLKMGKKNERESALNQLASIFAKQAVDDLIAEKFKGVTR